MVSNRPELRAEDLQGENVHADVSASRRPASPDWCSSCGASCGYSSVRCHFVLFVVRLVSDFLEGMS